MKKTSSRVGLPALHPRFRISCGKEIAFGPGKADLLELIMETGSIGRAAARMGMSYMRAWLLIQAMNRCFKQPVIATAHGGRERGGAQVTETGRRLLELYRRMEKKGMKSIQPEWRELQKFLRD